MTNSTSAWNQAIQTLESTTRKRWQTLAAWSLLNGALIGALIVVLAAHWGWSLELAMVLALGTCALTLSALLALPKTRTLWRASQDKAELARLFRALHPSTGTAVESAVEFVSRTGQLSEKELDQTFQGLHVVSTLQLLEDGAWNAKLTESIKPATQNLRLSSSILAVLLLICTAVTDQGRARISAWLEGDSEALKSDAPLVADITITTQYPAYTKLPLRTIEGSDGTIEGLKGSIVTVSVFPMKPDHIPFLETVSAEGNSNKRVQAQAADDNRFEFIFTLDQSHRYHFGLVDTDGFRLIETRQRQILVKPDTPPAVSITASAPTIELREDEGVPISWRSDDDFGVERSDVVIAPVGGESPIRIRLDTPGPALKSDRGQWVFTPKVHLSSHIESLELWVESTDNDATTGGNTGTSRRIRIEVLSARRQHQKLLSEASKLHDKLIDLLAIEWEEDLSSPLSSGRRPLSSQGRFIAEATTLASTLQAFSTALNEDSLAKTGLQEAFVNVSQNIETALLERQRLVRRKNAAKLTASKSDIQVQVNARTTLENDIIYLDDLLSLQRIDDLRTTTDELLRQRDELQNLLQAYRENQDPEMKEELANRIERLREQMNELLQEMASIRKSLPGEYRNLEASSANQVEDQLKRIDEAINEGDLEAAFQELDAISGMLEQMQRSLDQAEETYGDERYEEVREDVNEVMEDLSQVERRQEELNKKTEELYREARERRFQKNDTSENELREALLQEIRAALLSLDGATETQLLQSGNRQFGVTRESLFDMELAAEASLFNQVEDTFEDASRAWSSFSRFAQGRLIRLPSTEQTILKSVISDVEEHFERIAELLSDLTPEIDFKNDPKNQRALDELQKEQADIEQRAKETQAKLEDINAEMPIFGEDASKSWEQATQEMSEAQGAFDQRKLQQGKQHGRRALEQIRSFKKGLERAAQQNGQGAGPKIPLPFGSRQQHGQGRSGKGLRSNSQDVVLPQESDQRRTIRDDILEAAKQEAPEGYEEAVRRYYEELIR